MLTGRDVLRYKMKKKILLPFRLIALTKRHKTTCRFCPGPQAREQNVKVHGKVDFMERHWNVFQLSSVILFVVLIAVMRININIKKRIKKLLFATFCIFSEFSNPCGSSTPLTSLGGQITYCTAQNPNICPVNYYCHVGIGQETTVCCPTCKFWWTVVLPAWLSCDQSNSKWKKSCATWLNSEHW